MHTFMYNGHTLTWDEHTPGDHTFVFIHGYSVSQRSWVREIELFASRGRCVTLALPGHYPAKAPPNYKQLTQAQFIDLEARAVQHIADGCPVTLVGHSTGGLAALGIAAQLPDQVKRVICIDAVVWGPLTGSLGLSHRLLNSGLYPIFWAMWRFTQIAPWTIMVGLAAYAHDKGAHWQNSLAWNLCFYSFPWYRLQIINNMAVLINMLETCDVRPLAPKVKAPALILAGENDPIVPSDQARWLAANLPDADLHIFARTGHIPQLERPTEWELVVMDWLDDHPAIG